MVKVEPWPGREDWRVFYLKPLKFLKGKFSGEIKVFQNSLFPTDAPLLQASESALVFLKELPAYTSWKELIQSGVREEIVGGKQGIIKGADEVQIYSKIISQILAGGKTQAFYENLLNQKLSPDLLNAITKDYFKLFPASSFSQTSFDFWSGRFQDPAFPNVAKITAIKSLSEVTSEPANLFFRKLFCLQPLEVCLRAAETLESRGIPISISDYTPVLENGSQDLRVGLLSVLGRHHRADALPLFEKYLKLEKEEKAASTLIDALGDMGPPALDLVLAYAKDPRYQVQVAVVTSLGRFKNEKAISVLETYLKSKDPLLIMMSAESLRQIGTTKAVHVLHKYYEKDPHGYWEPTGPPEHFLPPR